jgi:hypothetical protein
MRDPLTAGLDASGQMLLLPLGPSSPAVTKERTHHHTMILGWAPSEPPTKPPQKIRFPVFFSLLALLFAFFFLKLWYSYHIIYSSSLVPAQP